MTEENHARDQAKAQLESIMAMVAALEADYDYMDTLRHQREEGEGLTHEEAQELIVLEESSNGCTSEDEAQQAIQEDPLSVQVRTGWYSPTGDRPEPEEFEILLCTGGPAVRIIGDLGEYNRPYDPRIQYQDWSTPWTSYPLSGDEAAIVVQYCENFYYGD